MELWLVSRSCSHYEPYFLESKCLARFAYFVASNDGKETRKLDLVNTGGV